MHAPDAPRSCALDPGGGEAHGSGIGALAMTWIVPVYNEELRLGGNVDAILRAAEARGGCEVLFLSLIHI